MPQALANGGAGFFAGMFRPHLLHESRGIADHRFIESQIHVRQACCASLMREP